MVLASILKERYREEGRQKGFEEGIARGRREAREEGIAKGCQEGWRKGLKEGWQEAYADWEAWYERRQQAARAGEPFDELPPTRNGRRRPWDTDQDAPPQEEPPCR